MQEAVSDRVRSIILEAIKDWKTISRSAAGNLASTKSAFDDWKKNLIQNLQPLLLVPPREYFSEAEHKPTFAEQWVAYRRRLEKLLVTVRLAPLTVLRDKVESHVFIVHGWDENNALRLQTMLLREFGVRPVVMKDAPAAAATLIEKLETLATEIDYAIVLWTPDDLVKGTTGDYRQPRPNVLFELGFFLARLGRERLCVLAKADVGKVPTDLSGVHYLPFKENVEELGMNLRRELQKAGIIS
jgi:hypothetical protein